MWSAPVLRLPTLASITRSVSRTSLASAIIAVDAQEVTFSGLLPVRPSSDGSISTQTRHPALGRQ